MPYRLTVRDISFFERPVTFARPFRFGAVVVNATPQMFVRVEIEVEGKGSAIGASAEFLVPKWFDKRPHLSPEETVDGAAPLAADRARTLSGAFRLSRPRSVCMPPASARRSRPAPRRTFRRWRRPTARPRSTRRSSTRCCAPRIPISSTAWRTISAASMRGCRAISVTTTSRNSWRDESGWSGSRSGTPSAWTTRSKARAVSPIPRRTPARATSSSS